MITRPYDGISPDVAKVLQSLISKDDDYNTVHTRRHARTLEILLEKNINGRVLELGTSRVIPLALKELQDDLDITVTDFFREDKVGSMTLSLQGKSMTVPCYSLDLESEPLPAADGTFDVVICSEVLEHMDVDPMYMMSEVNRVLKDGGLLFLSTPNINSTQALWKMLRGFEPYFYMQYHPDRNPYRHNYEYSIGALKSLLLAAGFEGELWTESCFEPAMLDDLKKLAEAGYFLQLDHMGDNLFAAVRKKSEVKERYPEPVYVKP